ncbi:MAG: hypothetical protein KF898_06185, partial [Parachlamydiales bacterium]|nr:hypothetical protein [Candidatus Acheromyda pituitae]
MAGKPLISKKLLSSPSLEAFEQFSPKEPSILIEELWDAPKAALIYLLLQSTKKNILVISSGSEDRLYQDISTLSGDSVLEFPSWETLPGEEILPSPDIVGKRFDTLF